MDLSKILKKSTEEFFDKLKNIQSETRGEYTFMVGQITARNLKDFTGLSIDENWCLIIELKQNKSKAGLSGTTPEDLVKKVKEEVVKTEEYQGLPVRVYCLTKPRRLIDYFRGYSVVS